MVIEATTPKPTTPEPTTLNPTTPKPTTPRPTTAKPTTQSPVTEKPSGKLMKHFKMVVFHLNNFSKHEIFYSHNSFSNSKSDCENTYCETQAAKGRCNKTWMKQKCKKACGLCKKLIS